MNDLPVGVIRDSERMLHFDRRYRGRRWRFSFGHDNVAAAEGALSVFYLDPEGFLKTRDTARARAVSVAKRVTDYIESRRGAGTKAKSRHNARRALDLMIAAVPQTMGAVERRHIEAWLATEADRVSPATVKTYFTHARAFWRWATDEGAVGRSPMQRMKAPRADVETSDRRRLVTPEEIEALGLRGRDADVVWALAGSGLRLGELMELDAAEVQRDGDGWRVWVGRTKGKRGRSVPVDEETAFCLQAAAGVPKAEITALRGRLDAAFVATGLRRWTFHALRHSRITSWVLEGHPLPYVQRWAGHSSIEITMLYVRI